MRSLLLVPLLVAPARAADVPLFDGKTLDGWTFVVKPDKDGNRADPKLTWSAKDGVLRCTGKPNGATVTAREYGDYELRLKWRFPAEGKGGNTGVLVHVQDDKYWPTSIECQLLTGRAGDLLLTNPPAAKLTVPNERRDPKLERRFLRIEPKEPPEKPLGEWNEMVITCKGASIELAVNGTKVNAGTECGFTKGKIALQSEGAEVHFKDIVLKPLK
jgi:hypothetical protein